MSFYDAVITKSPAFHSLARIHDMALLEPVTQQLVLALIADAAALGHRMVVLETYRSVERQKQLYAEGATQLETVGTHHFGVAVDIAIETGSTRNPTIDWAGADYMFLRPLAKTHHLVWGGPGPGNLNIGDLDHFQRCAFEDQQALFDLKWYPSPDYRAA